MCNLFSACFHYPVLVAPILSHYSLIVTNKVCVKVIHRACLPTHTAGVRLLPIRHSAPIEISDNHELAWVMCKQTVYIVVYNNIEIKEKYVTL